MKRIYSNTVLLTMMFLPLLASAQNLYISWKRLGDLALYINKDIKHGKYVYSPFRAFDFYIEKPLKSDHFAVGMEVGFSNYHPDLAITMSILAVISNFMTAVIPWVW